jgi:hypothetical protein
MEKIESDSSNPKTPRDSYEILKDSYEKLKDRYEKIQTVLKIKENYNKYNRKCV